MDDKYGVDGGVRGGVGLSTIYISYHKVYFVTDMLDGGFFNLGLSCSIPHCIILDKVLPSW